MIKIFALLFIGSLSYILGSYVEVSTDPNKEKVIQDAVIGIMDQYHYSPEDIDDDFSIEAYDYFLNYIDSRKRYLTQEDLKVLESYKTLIDDHFNQGSFDFFDKATELLEDRVAGVEALYQDLLSEPFAFDIDESFEFDSDKKEWPKEDSELRERWRKQLKYDVLTELTSQLEKQDEVRKTMADPKAKSLETEDETEETKKARLETMARDKELLAKSFAQLEIDARAEVLSDYNKWYKSFLKVRRSDRFESYLNTFAHMFDPHSDYFNPKEKQDFDINMGGKLEGIGARLRTEGDLTKVISIVPGGPVWKDKQIEVNNFILKVRQESEEESQDVFGMRIDDVVSLIRGKKGTHVVLTIKKKDGSIIDVDIERDVINILESFAKSAIIDLDGTIDNIGYIDLPKFYSSFDGPDGTSCAIDVAKEIKKLKANDVNGIILDLRNNGGGSLKDVVDMSGLFIENGPIVQVKPRDRRPYIYKDEDDNVQYNGPLIVMINSFSASASEILAAAMQDYDRAIIVGSQSFGKGTVQRFIDLDRAVKGNSEYKPLGQLKLTMQKFYRVNGGSTQLKGVQPDIEFPDRFRRIDIGEREYPNAMEWSQLSPLQYEQDVFKIPNRDALRMKSEARQSTSEAFSLLTEQGEWYKESRDKTSYSLRLDEHQQYLAQKKEQSAKYKNIIGDAIEALQIKNLPEDVEAINLDDKTVATNEEWLKALNKDVYLEETMTIMRDMIHDHNYTVAPSKP